MSALPASASPWIEPLESRIAPAAASIELASLDGLNGFKLEGTAQSEAVGRSVSGAGDVNGDGFQDLIVGASGASNFAGAIYVVFGKAGGFAATPELSTLDGSNGFKLQGEAELDAAGTDVAAAGDVNGDGFDDLLIGSLNTDPNGDFSGAAYLVFGKASGFTPALNLSALDGANGVELQGGAAFEGAGRSVSGAGDVNADGFDDLLIGASGVSQNGPDSGGSYVVFGKAGGFAATLNLATLDGTDGFLLLGEAADDQAGISVSGAGDVNGDGFADLLIGAFKADAGGVDTGATYVVFGKASGFTASLQLSQLNGTNGFKLAGAAESDFAGISVSGAGDVNGDGFADVMIGAPNADPNGTSSGASYVVFGKAAAFSATVSLSTLNGATGFAIQGELEGDNSGRSVSGAGDVNGDGFSDLIIGAAFADPNGNSSGTTYVVYGKASGFSAALNLSTMDGTNGFKVRGEAAEDAAGAAVGNAGDMNGDGFDDLIIGASGNDANASEGGAAYVIFGSGTAAVIVATNGKTATFTDWDGDLVTIKTTKGTLDAAQFRLSSPNALTGGSHLIYADFTSVTTGNEFIGANLTLIAKRGAAGGDGLVNVGTLDGRGVVFGKITIDGDLQQLDAAGAAGLTVYSLGQFLKAGVKGALVTSTIDGKLAGLTVKTDAIGVTVVAQTIGAIKTGDLDRVTLAAQTFGAITATGLDEVRIFAAGVPNPAAAANALALKSVIVSGTVRASQILAGYNASGAAVNADVAIGKVLVKGQWIATDLVAGAAAGGDGIFGTSDDTLIPGGNSVIAKIASVIITGASFGTLDNLRDGFGFVAEEIGVLSIGKAKLPLAKGARNDTIAFFAGLTGDVRTRELSS